MVSADQCVVYRLSFQQTYKSMSTWQKCIMTLFLQSFILESMAIELSVLKAMLSHLMCAVLCLAANGLPLHRYISRIKPNQKQICSNIGTHDEKDLEQSPFLETLRKRKGYEACSFFLHVTPSVSYWPYLKKLKSLGLFLMYRVHLTGSSTSRWSLLINVLCTGYLFNRPINRWALDRNALWHCFFNLSS